MKVTGWTWYDNPDYVPLLRVTNIDWDKLREVEEIVAEEVRKHQFRFTGVYHQEGDYGVPIIDGKCLFQITQRMWGDLMVKAYPDEFEPDDEYAYVIWAWLAPDDKPWKTPTPEDYTEVIQS